MSLIQDLIDRYKEARGEIESEIEKAPQGSTKEYERELLTRIEAVLVSAYAYTEQWSARNPRQLYDEALDNEYEKVKAQYTQERGTPPARGAWTNADEEAVENAAANVNTHLMDAVESTRQRMRAEIRQAVTIATEHAILEGQRTKVMQDALIEMLKERGVESVSYQRLGQTCYMQLDAYAELVARSAEHEIRNTANINLGQRIGNDLVKISSHIGSCPICEPYQGRVYSISGTHQDYPALYSTPFSREYQNFHPRCRHVASQYIEELQTAEEVAQMRAFSNRAFEVGGSGWTKKQVEAAEKSLASYRRREGRIRTLYNDRKQWERYKAILGDDAPKTLSIFRRIKNTNGERWHELQQNYRDTNREIADKIKAN